jgi:hypothetical protein
VDSATWAEPGTMVHILEGIEAWIAEREIREAPVAQHGAQ